MDFLPQSVLFYSLYGSDVVSTMLSFTRVIPVVQMKTLRCSITSC